MLRTLSKSLVGLVFPSMCDHCGNPLKAHEEGVCRTCISNIPSMAAPHCYGCGRTHLFTPTRCEACRDEDLAHDRAYACCPYDGTVKKMLQAYKFEGRRSLRPFFVGLLKRFSEQYIDLRAIDALVAVPMNPRKKLDRGFNQSELLASSLAKQLNIRYIDGALHCHKDLVPQSSLNKAQRKEHVRGAFVVRDASLIHDKHILLIDDIMTTGQTASECARALKKAGCTQVTVLTVARGL